MEDARNLPAAAAPVAVPAAAPADAPGHGGAAARGRLARLGMHWVAGALGRARALPAAEGVPDTVARLQALGELHRAAVAERDELRALAAESGRERAELERRLSVEAKLRDLSAQRAAAARHRSLRAQDENRQVRREVDEARDEARRAREDAERAREEAGRMRDDAELARQGAERVREELGREREEAARARDDAVQARALLDDALARAAQAEAARDAAVAGRQAAEQARADARTDALIGRAEDQAERSATPALLLAGAAGQALGWAALPKPWQPARRQERKARAWIAQANAARDARRFREAAGLYERALALRPDDAAIHVQCGHMHKEAGNLPEAEPHYLRAKALRPGDDDVALQLGHFYKVSGRIGEAVTAYRRALELRPGWSEPQAEIAVLAALRAR